MKIVVCIKQVPASSSVLVDSITGVLIRDGSNNKMNPYDLYAIETALKLKELLFDASITAVTMGPNQARDVLNEAIWMGVDDAILISDRKFAGSDVLSTARTISQGIKLIDDVAIVICGKQTTDGDTAQVGPEVAEFLGLPQATNVCDLLGVKDKKIVVRANYDNYTSIVELPLPSLITVDKDIYTPRLPSYKRYLEYKDKDNIKTITFNDLLIKDESLYGLNGSPTQVERIFSPTKNTEQKVIEGRSIDVSNILYTELKKSKFI